MGAERLFDDHAEVGSEPRGTLTLAPDSVVVRRNAGLLTGVAVLAGAVGAAYVSRAVQTGAVLDWVLAAALGGLALFDLAGAWDARTPLLVADTQGVRMRLGRTWRGLTWGAIERVEHEPATSRLRDGRLVVVARNEDRALDGLGAQGRRHAAWARRWYGSALTVPLGLATRSSHRGADLTEALHDLAALRTPVVTVLPEPQEDEAPDETVPETVAEPVSDDAPPEAAAADEAEHDEAEHDEGEPRFRDPRPGLAHLIARVGTLWQRPRAEDRDEDRDQDPVQDPGEDLGEDLDGDPADGTEDEPEARVVADPVSPLRATTPGRRAEVTVDLAPSLVEEADDDAADGVVTARAGELRRPGSVALVEEEQGWTDRGSDARVRSIAREGHPVEPIVIEEHGPEPAPDPVIGPELAAARTRLGLSVDDLASRTRIRAHVIEAVEVDDFDPCGGDFYARGHLRTLGRVLGVDAAPLLQQYDERYAHAPVTPRTVFEAELAGGGSLRSTRGGPNWSVLIAAVMALVLAWSVARLLMDSPVELRPTPALNGSAGPRHAGTTGKAVPVLLRAAGGGAHVVVRDGSGKVIFTGDIAYGQSKPISVAPPVRVESSDGSVEVVVDGNEKGAVGDTGQPATATYVVR